METTNINRVFALEKDNVIITAAQNNTPPNAEALQALEKFAERVGAEIIVLPMKYNKKAFSAAVEDERENWHPSVMPYLVKDSFTINDDIFVYSNCHILPTAKYPINAALDLSEGERITIVASPKMQQKEAPRCEGQERSTAYTTGCITAANYLTSRAGAVAEKSHKVGFLHVVDGRVFPYEYSETHGFDYAFKAMVVGDIHAESLDLSAFDRTIQQIQEHKIKDVIVHDLLDFKNRNGHERNNPTHLYKQQNNSVYKDLLDVCTVLQDLTGVAKRVHIVRSNHDDMLDRWLSDTSYQPHLDPKNAMLYYRLKYLQLQEIERGNESPNMLQIALKEYFKKDLPYWDNIKFLSLADSLKIAGVELAHHGHKGVNGARSGLQKTNQKMIVGHSHSGQRIDDFVTVGTIAKLKQGYNVGGGSSWTQHNALICESGRIVLAEV